MDRKKRVQYTRHARIRMLERNYVGHMVEKTLLDRDDEYSGNIPGSTVAVKNLGGLRLHVCYLEFDDYYLICSVFEDAP